MLVFRIKHSTKAMLLSVFVMPGTGHILLKRIPTGIVLIGLTITALLFLAPIIFGRAFEIANMIVAGDVAPDITTIRELVSSQHNAADNAVATLATTVLVMVWVFGVVNLYFVDKQIKSKK